jgi:hypothetical protein
MRLGASLLELRPRVRLCAAAGLLDADDKRGYSYPSGTDTIVGVRRRQATDWPFALEERSRAPGG